MKLLTTKQRQLLSYIQRHIDNHGESPTVKEMMERFSWDSESSVTRKLNSLEAKGKITRIKGKHRNVRICA